MKKKTVTLAAGATALAAAAGAVWWFTDTAPYPYDKRRLLDLPLPFLRAADIDRALDPADGERMLEIGPGTGLQSLHVAPQLGCQGRLDIVDIQQKMLDHVQKRAADAEISTIHGTRADATCMPFDAGTFDAVYLVTTLGEIGAPRESLTEFHRVLRPGGRLVVGEFFDRHWIPFGRLRSYADDCGFQLQERHGPTVAYLATFVRS
ncbi:class I SAM-dependent methyltransferase [Fodinicola feengrottensis]|uniref:Methyltransferase domain-containing protein n=1 Tax=Fodinicola feengrottensis TaxID=435914 RepID=A0ABP4UQH3_9ACTN|nr:methyltransferase domain-containing protein [Fodinicola feengrottensis]